MVNLLVKDLMTEKVFAVRPDDDLSLVRDMMLDHAVRHVPVVDFEGDLLGLVSHRDLLRAAVIEQEEVPAFVQEAVLEGIRAGEVMVRDVESVGPEDDLREAAAMMLENKYGCLPVVLGRRLVGILTEADFVRLHAEAREPAEVAAGVN
jgi:CBS domain-containing membrane protein